MHQFRSKQFNSSHASAHFPKMMSAARNLNQEWIHNLATSQMFHLSTFMLLLNCQEHKQAGLHKLPLPHTHRSLSLFLPFMFLSSCHHLNKAIKKKKRYTRSLNAHEAFKYLMWPHCLPSMNTRAFHKHTLKMSPVLWWTKPGEKNSDLTSFICESSICDVICLYASKRQS